MQKWCSRESIAVDSAGNIYIPDSSGTASFEKCQSSTGHHHHDCRNWNTRLFGGDNGPATSAELNTPMAVAVDASGNIYIADCQNNRIRKVTVSTGVITTVAGFGDFEKTIRETMGLRSTERSTPLTQKVISNSRRVVRGWREVVSQCLTCVLRGNTDFMANGTIKQNGQGSAVCRRRLCLPCTSAIRHCPRPCSACLHSSTCRNVKPTDTWRKRHIWSNLSKSPRLRCRSPSRFQREQHAFSGGVREAVG